MAFGACGRHRVGMAYVITSRCVGVRDGACRDVCPVDCIHDAGEQFVIHPVDCIGCGACVNACPVGAISDEPDVPESESASIRFARAFFAP